MCATWFLAVGILALGSIVRPVSAQPPRGGNPEDKTAILKRADAFVGAFHKGDAKAVAAFWTKDRDYTNVTGKRLSGRGSPRTTKRIVSCSG